MTDVFEPIREEIRFPQRALKRREDDFHQLQRQTSTERGYLPLHGPFHAIVDLGQNIIALRGRMPPYAEERDGVVWLIPVTEPINPREEV